jgi:iron complex transport system substrate-binding protein
MKPLNRCVLAVLLAGWCAPVVAGTPRLVTVGPEVTETVFALGMGAAVVGRDLSSAYPEGTKGVPQVGYHRSLSAEGILSLRPTRVLVHAEGGPPRVLEQLRAAGIAVEVLAVPPGAEGARQLIRNAAKVLGREEEGKALLAKFESELTALQVSAQALSTRPPRVLCLYARSAQVTLASGTGTAADALIRLSGGVNALEGFAGFKPLNPEAALAGDPEVLLMPESTLATLGGREGVARLPALSTLNAARKGKVVTLPDVHFFGAGPRLGSAARSLSEQLAQAMRR